MEDLRGLPLEEQKQILRARREEKKRNAQLSVERGQQSSENIRPDQQIGPAIGSDITALKKQPANNDNVKASNTTTQQQQSSLDVRGETTSQPKSSSGERRSLAFRNPAASSIPSAYCDERRRPSSNAKPSTVPKSTLASEVNMTSEVATRSAGPSTGQVASAEYPFTERIPLPGWLHSVKITTPVDRGLLLLLNKIRNVIPLAMSPDEIDRETRFNEIREYLHQYEHKTGIGEGLVKRSRLLEPMGLPQLFLERKDGFEFPSDIRADAKMVYNKWAQHDFSADIMRGLDWGKKTNSQGRGRHSTSLDPNYPNRVSWRFFGAGDLVSGQWWPLLLACMRDGAHGSSEAGISRLNNKGAVSVLISNSHYEDIDEGDTIFYCGTEGFFGNMTDDTKALHDNIRSGEPVRVIRSASLPKENQLRPEFGYRYDGVYEVKGFTVLDSNTAYHRFRLERLPNQDPIRWSGIGARPTKQDKEAYQLHRTLVGMLP